MADRISEIKRHKELTILKRVEEQPDFILKLKSPGDDELELAFDLNPELALHFPALSESLQGFIVEKNPEHIKYIVKPTKKVERFVVFRGYADHRNGYYYWQLANKKPRNFTARIQAHPFIGLPSGLVVGLTELIITRPFNLIFIGFRIFWRWAMSGEKEKSK